MRKLLGFLLGLSMLTLSVGMLYLAGGLYNAGEKSNVEAYVFQSADLSADRLPTPLSADQMDKDLILNRLLKKFVYEYFYAVPDQDNIARRMRSDSVMSVISNPDIFADWKRGEAEVIKELVARNMLRQVIIGDHITQMGEYWRLEYELKTWSDSNDMEAFPKSSRGAILLNVNYMPGIRDNMNGNPFDAEKYLRRGGDAAAVFWFKVKEVK